MKNAILTAALILCAAATASAQTYQTTDASGRTTGGTPYRPGAWEIGGNASAVFYDEDLDETGALHGRVMYWITEMLAIGAESGIYFDTNVDDVDELDALDDRGDLTGIPLLGLVEVRLPLDWAVSPYVVGGAGVIFWDFDQETDISELDDEAEFAAKIGVGFDWFVTERFALNIEASYGWSDTDIRRITGGQSRDDDADHVLVGGGVKFFF